MKNKALKIFSIMLSLILVINSAPFFVQSADLIQEDSITILKKNPASFEWDSEDVAYIDFSEVEEIPLNDTVKGQGLTLFTNESTGNTRASNRTEDGYLLLGYQARENDNPNDMIDKPYVNGAIYIKVDKEINLKSATSYAVKIDYYGGGNGTVNSGSYIDLVYSTKDNNNTKKRNIYGATYNTSKIESMYYALEDADLKEVIGGCKADFRLETWCGDSSRIGAQLKIKRISVLPYENFEAPALTEVEPEAEQGKFIASIDFSKFTEEVPTSGTVTGDGIILVTSQSTGNTRASNIVQNGNLLLGYQARTNDNPADMEAKPYVTGASYFKLNIEKENKANKSYAVKIDYYGGGIETDSGSYIDLRYNNSANNNDAKVRKTYGSTYNSGKIETMYFLLEDANFAESLKDSNCGADFRLETWDQAQLQIRAISVAEYDPQDTVENYEEYFIPGGSASVYTDVNKGEYYGLIYPSSSPVVKIIDADGTGHYAVGSEDYLNFKITDSIVKNTKNVTLSISYWDIGRNSFSIEYNSVIPNPLPDNTGENFYNYYSTSSFEMYDTKELITLDIPLRNAAFSGKQSGGYDFRIRSLYVPDFYIENITIKTGVYDISKIEPVDFPKTTELNNFEGKTVVGYQAWFQASDSKTSGWKHWAAGSGAPSANNQTFDVYPDVTDFDESVLYETGYGKLLNGNTAILYDGVTKEAIETQVKWMRDYGIDGFAVSRFYGGTSEVEIKATNKLDYMKEMAEKYGRIFYMGYDMSGIGGAGEAGIERLKADFVLNVEKKFVVSPNYAQINGKPVVSLWGFQGSLFDRYPNAQNALTLIEWFHNRGYYIIGGCPDNNWALDTTSYKAVYEAIDMISPWTVGRYNTSNAISYLEKKYTQDKAWIEAFNAKNPDNKKSYLPTILPGFSWANWASGTPNAVPRNAGQFMWDQAKVTREYGFTSSFIAMFDEFDEGTAIAKMAEDSFSIPSDQYFVTGAADGSWVSSDFYLRLTNAIARLLRGEIQITDSVPISYSEGPVFWRNSFEKRWLTYVNNSGKTVNQLMNIDVCLNNPELVESSNVTITKNEITENKSVAKTGNYAFALAGESLGKAKYSYKIADTKIVIRDKMELNYTLFAQNNFGKNVFVDLLFENGKRLSELQSDSLVKYEYNGNFINVTVPISSTMKGETVKGILVCYQSDTKGDFSAYVDDIIIAYSETENISGDIDSNGVLDSRDLIELKKALFSSKVYSNMNINGDSNVDILDYIVLKKLLLNI